MLDGAGMYLRERTWLRVEGPNSKGLESNGDEFAQFVLSETVTAGAILFVLTLVGAAIAGAVQAIRPVPAPALKAGPSST